MARLSQEVTGIRKVLVRNTLTWLAALAPFIMTGCVHVGQFFSLGDNFPKAPVCQVVTTWTNQVMFTPDPVHGGASTPGMTGRLYLFDERGLPTVGDGGVTIELYDDSAKSKGGEPKLMEVWKFDKDTLRRLLSSDTIGWGYTLFLPWGTYSPTITAVHMKVRYEPPKGMPLYEQSGTVTLNGQGNASVRAEARSVVPTPENKVTVTKQ